MSISEGDGLHSMINSDDDDLALEPFYQQLSTVKAHANSNTQTYTATGYASAGFGLQRSYALFTFTVHGLWAVETLERERRCMLDFAS